MTTPTGTGQRRGRLEGFLREGGPLHGRDGHGHPHHALIALGSRGRVRLVGGGSGHRTLDLRPSETLGHLLHEQGVTLDLDLAGHEGLLGIQRSGAHGHEVVGLRCQKRITGFE